jgi:cytochrome c-type biogenesis protein
MTENISIFIAFGAGLLSFLSPCVLPLIPSWLCVIGGTPVSSEKNGLVLRTLGFVLGFSAVFIALSVVFTVTFGMAGGLFQGINLISGLVVIVLGLNMIMPFLSFLNYEKRFRLNNTPQGLIGAFLAGGAFGAGWTPCIGPALAAILLLAAQSGGIPRAVLYLSFFSAGMGLPFLFASVFFGAFVKASAALRARLPLIQRISGTLLIVIGITMITGHFRSLSALAAGWQRNPAGAPADRLVPAAASGDSAMSDNAVSAAVIDAFKNAGLPVASAGIAPPDFTLSALDGSAIRLSDLRGKVVFLNFWATWCGPCRAEMPSMDVVYQRLKRRGFDILAVNIRESPASAGAFVKEYKLGFPVVLDRDGRISAEYGIQAIPTSYIIDKRGLVISMLVGSIDWNTPAIIAALESLL